MVIDVLERDELPFPRSLPEFQRLFPNEVACATYLEHARWRDGFVRRQCGVTDEPYRFTNRPGVLRCRHCGRDTSLTAGPSWSARTRRSRYGFGLLTWSPARRRACRPSSFNGNSDCRSMRPPSRSFINSASAWCVPTKIESVGNLENTSRRMKLGWVVVRAARDESFTIRLSWLGC